MLLSNSSRVTRRQAREAAARYAGVTSDHVADAADSGGRFEAFGFTADTPDGKSRCRSRGRALSALDDAGKRGVCPPA
ncbi:MAG: hypothetical protein ACLS7Z_03175 [Christensenellales bacterium]